MGSLHHNPTTRMQGDYHNAAFDAIVTGVVFVALAHVYVVIRCSDVDDKPRSLWRLLISCREEVANKVPISMIDARFCNMVILFINVI
nr:unnamed protein product [Haemonchus contortus]